jgi:hypothetical protein
MSKKITGIIKAIVGVVILPLLVLISWSRFTDIIPGESVDLTKEKKAKKQYTLNGFDGPYLIGKNMFTVDRGGDVKKAELQSDIIKVQVDNADADQFMVPLRTDPIPPKAEYALPEKLIAISDIEGNFDAFSGFLLNNGVIDTAFNWTFEQGHLVLVGDFVDRGNNVLPVLWLIYKLEQEAREDGGQVHFILGNHEIMKIQGNFYYAKDKYKRIASTIGSHQNPIENQRLLFSEQSHLGKWLRSKNIIEKIGDYMFVHAGLAPDILDFHLSLPEMNAIARQNIDKDLFKNQSDDEKVNFVMGAYGPFWYRGFVDDYKYYNKIKPDQLDAILSTYHVNRFVVGHTIVEEISKDFEGKVIRLDVKHGKSKYSEKTQGMIIEGGQEYIVNALGQRTNL